MKRIINKIYNKTPYGQKIFDIAIQIYNSKITRKINHDELLDTIYKFNNISEDILNGVNLINDKKYCLNTHYCGECLKKFVLVRDLRNVKHNYDYIDEVNISYTRCKYIFI